MACSSILPCVLGSHDRSNVEIHLLSPFYWVDSSHTCPVGSSLPQRVATRSDVLCNLLSRALCTNLIEKEFK